MQKYVSSSEALRISDSTGEPFFYSRGHPLKSKARLYSLLLHAVAYFEEHTVNISCVCCMIKHNREQNEVQDLFSEQCNASSGEAQSVLKDKGEVELTGHMHFHSLD